MKRAFVFPGQGSQAVGMGRGLAEAFRVARDLFEEVDETLSQPLSRLMFEGPESDLTLTENAQPALLAASLAAIRVLESEGGLTFGRHVVFVAGHSLGEYSALAAVRAVTVAEAVRLVKLRGRTMQQAVPVGTGAMAALLGLDVEAARTVVVEAVRSEPRRDLRGSERQCSGTGRCQRAPSSHRTGHRDRPRAGGRDQSFCRSAPRSIPP